jgi:hypothetical protein
MRRSEQRESDDQEADHDTPYNADTIYARRGEHPGENWVGIADSEIGQHSKQECQYHTKPNPRSVAAMIATPTSTPVILFHMPRSLKNK